jgi:uncharacterized protein
MKAFVTLLLLSGCAFFLVSCASVSHYQEIDADVARGDFRGGLEKIRAVKGKAYRNTDQILYYLDEGMLAHYAGDWTGSSKSLGTAERGIESAFTKSVTLAVSSYLVNDTTLEYPGEDYEDLYLNAFNSLNYYHAGSTEDALVEIRRIDNKLKFLSTKYGTAITNAQSAVLEKSNDIPYDSSASRVEFTNSALGRYLSMLFFRSEGKSDDARIDRDQIKLAFANQPAVYGFPLPSSLNDELSVPKGKARLNVISFSGLSPVKTESTTRIGLGDSHWLKIALPVITQRPTQVARTEVVLDSGERFQLELIENMGAVAADTFKQKAALIYFKTIARSLVKTSSSIALNEKAHDSGDNSTALLLGVLSLGTQIYAEASEQADLRMSRYFPSRAYVGGITIDPGVCSYTVRYFDASNRLIQEQRFENVRVQENQLNLSEAICIK